MGPNPIDTLLACVMWIALCAAVVLVCALLFGEQILEVMR